MKKNTLLLLITTILFTACTTTKKLVETFKTDVFEEGNIYIQYDKYAQRKLVQHKTIQFMATSENMFPTSTTGEFVLVPYITVTENKENPSHSYFDGSKAELKLLMSISPSKKIEKIIFRNSDEKYELNVKPSASYSDITVSSETSTSKIGSSTFSTSNTTVSETTYVYVTVNLEDYFKLSDILCSDTLDFAVYTENRTFEFLNNGIQTKFSPNETESNYIYNIESGTFECNTRNSNEKMNFKEAFKEFNNYIKKEMSNVVFSGESDISIKKI